MFNGLEKEKGTIKSSQTAQCQSKLTSKCSIHCWEYKRSQRNGIYHLIKY